VNNLDGGEAFLAPRQGDVVDKSTVSIEQGVKAVAVGPVLAAVDVSWDSRAALLWACRYAASIEAAVGILHVLHDPAEAPGKYSGDASDPLAPMFDTAEKMLAEFMAEVRENHSSLAPLQEARTKILPGLPAQTIVDEAMRMKAKLIVVGSRGHTGLPRLMFGSTARRVAQLSPIPVTVVKPGR
jgi:nucleotide-binding universal stress UspA family protein